MRFDHLVAVCETCLYRDEGSAPSDPTDGNWVLCCRHPPVVLRVADDGFPGGVGVFPRVDRFSFCGEWVLNLACDDAQKANLSHAITLSEYYQLVFSLTPLMEKE